jgi:delta14-sterol reductase
MTALHAKSKSKTTTTTATTTHICPPSEFGGPIGCLLTIILLPVLVLILAHWAKIGYLDLNFISIKKETFILLFGGNNDNDNDNNNDNDNGNGNDNDNDSSYILLFKCLLGLLGWFITLVILWIVLPGQWVEGAPVIDPEIDYTASASASASGTNNKDKPKLRLKYKLNGHLTFWIIMIALAVTKFPLNDYLYKHYEKLAFVDILLCFGLSTYLYITSFINNNNKDGKNSKNCKNSKKKILSHTGRSNNHIYDYFMGRELNPRSINGKFDWKQFCELRPGLILWLLLNFSCAQEQYVLRNGSISGSMILLNIFHFIYVWDSLYNERSILTTMDITTDGFGFMLIFGDMCWVPFTYNHTTKYLVNHDPQLSIFNLILIFILYVVGFYIFRSSNKQKDIFRSNPLDARVNKLNYIKTIRGTCLLTSGWWGYARKINYTGDYIMGLSYSLLCGFNSIVPYYYSIYFLILLVHRSIRDDELCSIKYGNDWIEYKRQVPYRFIPGIV